MNALKSKIDKLNSKNECWIPDAKLEGKLADVKSMLEAAVPVDGWCDCDECGTAPVDKRGLLTPGDGFSTTQAMEGVEDNRGNTVQ